MPAVNPALKTMAKAIVKKAIPKKAVKKESVLKRVNVPKEAEVIAIDPNDVTGAFLQLNNLLNPRGFGVVEFINQELGRPATAEELAENVLSIICTAEVEDQNKAVELILTRLMRDRKNACEEAELENKQLRVKLDRAFMGAEHLNAIVTGGLFNKINDSRINK